MVAETRSQRRQSYMQQRPPYPQITPSSPTSSTSSVFQSSSSLASLSSMSSTSSTSTSMSQQQQQQHQQQQQQYQKHQQQLQYQHNPFASAPLPSPSTNQQPTMNYFGSQAIPTSQPSSQQQQQQQQRLQPHQYQNAGSSYLGQRGDGGGIPETAPFLKDFNLVAEAAKRAQMACLTRDLGDVGL